MRRIARLKSFWRNLVRRERVERELDEELSSAYALLVEEKLAAGLSGKAARRAARLELGSLDSVKEEIRAQRAGALVDGLRRDVRYGVRTLRRGGVFSVVAVVTLALGIGANSAIFSLVNGLLLRPLPWPESDRLVWIASLVITPANLTEWRGLRTLEQASAFDLRTVVRTSDGPAERLSGMVVTREYLPLLGARPMLGRYWTEEERRPGGPATIVVSERLWNRLSEAAIGRTQVVLDGAGYTIVGVLPADFENLHYESEVWFPAEREPGSRYNLIALRRAEAPITAVRAEATALAERVDVAGAANTRRFANVQTLSDVYRGEVREGLLVLSMAAGFVLLIACANVANLLLARAAGRAREMAVRGALGAGHGVLLRQLLAESAVLAVAGSLVGALVAGIGLRAVLAVVPEFYGFGRIAGVRMDVAAFLFTLGVAVLCTLLAGLAPAFHSARQGSGEWAGGARTSATRRTRRSREVLMTIEIALALVLLIGSLLLVRTYLVLRPSSPGFEPADRLVASLRLPAVPPRDDAGLREFARRLTQALEAAAPTARLAIATDVPMSGSVMRFPVAELDGEPVVTDDQRLNQVDVVAATPNYFDVIGMRRVRGRGLEAAGGVGAPPVMVVNESAAARFWPDADPIGRRMTVNLGARSIEFTVVGVAGNTRNSGLHTRSLVTVFISYWQVPFAGFEIVVHQPGEPLLNGEAVRNAVAAIDPGVPIGSIRMMDQMLARAVAEPRYQMILMMVFGGLAVLLALVGCYGVLSYAVATRTREIGVRTALGASRRAIVASVVLRAAALLGPGLALGTALALALTRVLQSSLYGVTATDPATFAGAAAGLAAVSLLAAWLPARRAARIPPTEALRTE